MHRRYKGTGMQLLDMYFYAGDLKNERVTSLLDEPWHHVKNVVGKICSSFDLSPLH